MEVQSANLLPWLGTARAPTGGGGRSGEGIPADARSKPGSGGQLIAFVPSLDLVITRQTGSSGEWAFEEYLRRACAAIDKRPKKPRGIPSFAAVSQPVKQDLSVARSIFSVTMRPLRPTLASGSGLAMGRAGPASALV